MTRSTLASVLLLAIVSVIAGCRSQRSEFIAMTPDATSSAIARIEQVTFEEPAENDSEEAVRSELTIASEPQAAVAIEEVPAEPRAELVPPPSEPPATTSLEEVVRSVVEYFPVIQQVTAGRGIASGEVLSAYGAFDHKLDLFYESQPLAYYENHRGNVGVKRDTFWGGQTFAGYRVGRGLFEPWYLERETNKGGEFKAGFLAPLIRDRAIDANRSELWQAQVERSRIEAEIQIAVIQGTRDGSVAYWEWVAAGENLRIAENVLRLGVERREFLEKQIVAGEKKAIDRVDNRRIIVSREAKVVDARRKLQQAAAKLSLYLRSGEGRPLLLTGEPSRDAFLEGMIDSLELNPDDLRLAQQNRPEPRELNLVRRQLGIALQQATNESLPDVDVGLLVAQDVGEPTSAKRDKSPLELEAQLTLSVPLERRKALGKMRQLRSKIAQVRAKQQLTLEKIVIDVQVATAALEAAEQRVRQTTEGFELAQQMNRAERQLFDAGQSELFNLNIRELQAADAAAERVNALLDYHVALADYAAALGIETTSLLAELAPAPDPPRPADEL